MTDGVPASIDACFLARKPVLTGQGERRHLNFLDFNVGAQRSQQALDIGPGMTVTIDIKMDSCVAIYA